MNVFNIEVIIEHKRKKNSFKCERGKGSEGMTADVVVDLLHYISFCGLQSMPYNASYRKTGNNRTGTTPLTLSCKHGQGQAGPQNQHIFCHSLSCSLSPKGIHMFAFICLSFLGEPVRPWVKAAQTALRKRKTPKPGTITQHHNKNILRVGGS